MGLFALLTAHVNPFLAPKSCVLELIPGSRYKTMKLDGEVALARTS